ncbi:MAG: tetratricopeptide repeat protein [Planctomycetota bacterium]|nr:MAG: tetratricopeptide repeat protein [Planctomycetota bacterium]REK38443.1 MAG: tetratricopeptide repeat protein [Planctomycetota bacterium]
MRTLANLLITIAAVAAAVWWLGSQTADRTSGVPAVRNVLIISIDTLRADHLGCYGFQRPTSPNIDALAADGLLFERAQTTNPLTLPAHSSLMTGKIPPAHGALTNQGHTLAEANVTLAEILRDEGWQTGAVVGAYPLESRFGLAQGFADYDDEFDGSLKAGLFTERSAESVSRAAIDWLERRGDDPFFMFVHYYDPHQRYLPPEPFNSAYPQDKYSGEIAYTDHWVGKLIERLQQLELYDSTLIVLTSDHGESLGEHGEISHGFFIYQPVMHIPLIVRLPQGPRGQRLKTPVSLVDVMPTVLELAGRPLPSDLQGISLAASFRNGVEPPTGRDLYSDSWYPAKFACAPLRGLLQDQWRYVWSVRPELYNLHEDPREAKNVLDQHSDVAARLAEGLQTMLAAAPSPATGGSSTTPDAAARARLRSLGYLGGGDVEASAEIDDSMRDAKDYIAVLSEYSAAVTFQEQGKLAEARDVCLKILRDEPRMLQAHLLLGEIASATGDSVNAERHYDDVLTIAADARQAATVRYETVVAHSNLALLRLEAGDRAGARGHLNRVLDLEPGNLEAQLQLADIQVDDGQFDEARDTLRGAVESAPQSLAARLALARFFLREGRMADAREHVEEAIRIDPTDGQAMYLGGLTATADGDERTAIERLRKALAADPGLAAAANDLAWLLATSHDETVHDAKEAVRWARKANELTESAKVEYLDTLAVAEAADGDFDAAVRTAERAAKLAEAAGDTAAAQAMRGRIVQFRRGIPYRQPAPSQP